MNLNDAITAVEQGLAAYDKAATTTQQDQAAADAADAKAKAAHDLVGTDQKAQADAATSANAALDALIAAANAAKIPTTA